MNDRLRETDALPFSEPELKGWQMGADSGATATNHNVRRFLATIERQGKALRAVEALCDEADAYYRQEFTGMVLTKEIRAALVGDKSPILGVPSHSTQEERDEAAPAQTEPQTERKP